VAEGGDEEAGSCPRAEAAAGHRVNLPTHRRVASQDVEAIVSAVASAAMMVRGGRGHDADMAQRLLGGYTLFVLAK
jgi:hypothetical protein